MFNSKGGFGQTGGFNQSGFGGDFGGNSSMAVPGGGFLTSPGKSPMGSTQKDKKQMFQNMMPITVAQVLTTAEADEHVKVGSLTAAMLTLVGQIRSVDEQSTRIILKLDDMTGPPLEVQQWMGENDDTNAFNRSNIRENMYVRVLGSLRKVKGVRLISAFRIVPILDLNDITMHMLEVVHTHMSVAAMDKEPLEEKMDTSMGVGAFGNNMTKLEPNSSTDNLGLTKQQNMVYKAITTVHTEDGISKDTLCKFLSSMPRSAIDEHLRFLCNEGHIYTTIDDDHYKTIDSM